MPTPAARQTVHGCRTWTRLEQRPTRNDVRGGRGTGRGRVTTQGGTRVRRIEGEKRPKLKVLYKISDWRRDSLLEMIGVDPFDANTQQEYHRRQGLDPQAPPFCIRMDTCPGQHHVLQTVLSLPLPTTMQTSGAIGSNRRKASSRRSGTTMHDSLVNRQEPPVQLPTTPLAHLL